MIRVLMYFGSRCKTIFSLFQAVFVHRYGNRTGSGEISKLLPSYLKQNSCVDVFENAKCVPLPGLSPPYEQSSCWCLADGVRRGVGLQHLNRM